MAIKQIFGEVQLHPEQVARGPVSVPFDYPGLTELPFLDSTHEAGTGAFTPGPTPAVRVPNKINALVPTALDLDQWFELPHAIPRRIDEGQVLSTINIPVTVHNAYRRTTITWNSFVNGAGAGSSMTGPTPPQTIQPQASISNASLIFVITTDGVPVVDDTLDYGFTSGITLQNPIEFSRLVSFLFEPNGRVREELGFLTEIITSKDGTEQRRAMRRYPRQKFRYEFREEESELSRLIHTLAGRPGGTYGIPLWHESCVLSQAATALDTVLNVDSTAYRDFRVLGTAIIFSSLGLHDILQVDSFTANTITAVNPIVQSYPAGTRVMPVRIATTGTRQRGSRWPRRAGRLQVEFTVKDVDVDLADTSAFDTLNSKVLIDDGNGIQGTSSIGVEAPIVVLDPDIGARSQYEFVPTGRMTGQKSWPPQGIQKLWEIRQLLHALRGRQISFYLPDDRDDLITTTDITVGANSFTIENAGMNYVLGTTAVEYIRFTESDGTVTTVKALSAAVSANLEEETVTIDGTFPATILAADVVRCEVIRKVRFDRDRIAIVYEPGRSGARVTNPVRTVLD